MTDNDNKLVEQFFQTHQLPLPDVDNAFTQRVMYQLPKQRAYLLNRLWTVACVVAIVVAFVWMHGLTLLTTGIGNMLGDLLGFWACVHTNPFSPILLVVCLVLMGGAGVYKLFNKTNSLYLQF